MIASRVLGLDGGWVMVFMILYASDFNSIHDCIDGFSECSGER